MATTTRILDANVNGTVYTTNANSALEALDTCHSGAVAPTDEVANGKLWLDTSTTPGILKIYNNATWEVVHSGTVDINGGTIDGATINGTVIGGTTPAAVTTSSLVATTADINGGTIDGVIIGGTAPSAITGTTLTATGAFTSLGIDDNAAATAMTIDSSGNVGIGTSTPEDKLSLQQPYVASGEMAISFSQSAVADRATKIIHKMDASGNGGNLLFSTNPNGGDATERMRIDSSGHAIIPAGVTLGTAAGVYSAANTLDDYEEGTWTPGFSDGTNSDGGASVRSGKYTKIGNKVHAQGRLAIVSLGSMSGGIRLTGLPVVASGGTSIGPTLSIGRASGLTITAGQTVTGYVSDGTTFCVLNLWDNGGGTSGFLATELTSDGDLTFSIDYLTA